MHSFAFHRICLSSARRENAKRFCSAVTCVTWHSFVCMNKTSLCRLALSVALQTVTWKVRCFVWILHTEWSFPPCSLNVCGCMLYLCFAGDTLRLVNFRPHRLTNFLSFLTSPPVCACSWQTGWVTLPALWTPPAQRPNSFVTFTQGVVLPVSSGCYTDIISCHPQWRHSLQCVSSS